MARITSFVSGRDEGIEAYRVAAAALASVAAALEPDDWPRQSACDGWSVLDLVGHVVCVARWHHHWLDRAEGGDTSPPFPLSEMAERSECALRTLEIDEGPDRVEAFVRLATAYASRVGANWDLPYSFPAGVVPAGLHAVLAAGEWHLHAWDISRSFNRDYTADAELIRAAWLTLDRPVSASGDAFRALLEASGRLPNGHRANNFPAVEPL